MANEPHRNNTSRDASRQQRKSLAGKPTRTHFESSRPTSRGSHQRTNGTQRKHHANSRKAHFALQESQLRTIAIFVVASVLVIAFFSATHACSRTASNTKGTTPATTSPYDWTNLRDENGRYVYYVDGKAASRQGIDVSDSQGYIDWSQVAGDGIDFAIVRVGYRGTTQGDVHSDEYFDYNIDNAKKNGLDVGIYFYSQAVNEQEAREEAQFCLTELNGRSLQYPVVYDFEETATHDGRADGVSTEQATANARAFCETIEAAGYSVMIYGNQQDLSDYDQSLLEDYPVWYAEYGSLPTSNHTFTIWQYSNTGSVAGIDTDVDLDIDLSGV